MAQRLFPLQTKPTHRPAFSRQRNINFSPSPPQAAGSCERELRRVTGLKAPRPIFLPVAASPFFNTTPSATFSLPGFWAPVLNRSAKAGGFDKAQPQPAEPAPRAPIRHHSTSNLASPARFVLINSLTYRCRFCRPHHHQPRYSAIAIKAGELSSRETPHVGPQTVQYSGHGH